MQRTRPQSSPNLAQPGVLARVTGAALMLLAMSGAHAANPLDFVSGDGTASAATDAASKPEIIAAGDIPVRADADERFVQDLARRARQKDPGTQLGPRLANLSDGIERLSRSFSPSELRDLPVVRLQSLERHWRFFAHELDDWRRELDHGTAPYSTDAAALAERRATWEATQQSLADVGVTTALSDRVGSILSQIRIAERALSGPLDAQIRLGRRANVVQAKIDAGRKVVDGAIDEYDRRLWTIDAPPAWEAWQATRFSEREVAGAGAGLQAEGAFLNEWGAANRERILGFKLAMLALLPLLVWLAVRNRDVVATEPGMQAASRVLQRPVSAWLVLAFVGLLFLFPDAPPILLQIALLLALIPVLRLLPPTMYAVLGAWPYVVTALYVTYRLNFLLLGEPLLYRMYLLAVAVVNAGALVWLLLSSRSDPPGEPSKRIRGVARGVGWLAIAALVVGIGANVVGNVTLAGMLTGAVLDSAYIGFALFAGANVLSSVVRLAIARRSVSRWRLITQHAGPLLASAHRLIMLVALVTWLIAAGNEFRIARPVFGWIKSVLTYPLEVGEISITLGSILLFGLAIWVAIWVARTVRLILRDEVLPTMELPRGVGNSISTLSYYGLVIVGLMIALAAAGFQASQFALVFGALGVGIGFGLQNVVNNFVSGLILMFERPIQPGDVVEVSGTSGKVRDIGMRATTLTTFEGADVIVPNGTLLSEKLINWTLSDMNRRIDVEVGVAYGSDPRRVIALLQQVAQGTPGIAPDPAPAIVFKGFGANSLDFGIRAWTHDFGDWVTIRTEMTARVYEALRTENIEIPVPQQDLHLRSVSLEAATRLAGAAPPSPAPGREC